MGSIAAAFAQFPRIGPVLPALGYSRAQRDDLRQTIANVPCEAVLLGTTVDLALLLGLTQPVARVRIEPQDLSAPSLAGFVLAQLDQIQEATRPDPGP